MGFVLDDHYVIARNPVIKNPSLYPQILTNSLFEAAHRAPESKLNYYRPFLLGSFAVDYQLWGLNAFGYRIINILLHAANSVLVFILLFLLFKNKELAGLASFIFCILPTHEWVVRYIVGRGDLLQTFFSLISFASFTKYSFAVSSSEEGNRGTAMAWRVLSLGAFLFAILSREVAVLNVVYIFMISWYLTRDFKKVVKPVLPFFVLSVLYGAVRGQIFPIVSGPSVNGFALDFGQGVSLSLSYVLHFFSPALIQTIFPKSILAAGILAFLFLIFIVRTLLKKAQSPQDARVAGFGILWVIFGVLPFIVTQRVIDRLGPVLSEHFLYFSSIGFALLWALILYQARGIFARNFLFVVSVLYFLGVGFVNGCFWQDEETLLRHVRQLEKKEFTVAYEQIAMRFEDNETAVKVLMDRASSDPIRSLWLRKLGNIYHRRADYPKAVDALTAAVELNPSNVDALNELGAAYLEKGETAKGFEYLYRSLKVDSSEADTYRLLGTAFYQGGNFSRAIPALQKALFYDPDERDSSFYLMMAYFFSGARQDYLNSVEETTKRFSDDRLILKFTARELFVHGYFADALKVLATNKQLFIDDPEALSILRKAREGLSRSP